MRPLQLESLPDMDNDETQVISSREFLRQLFNIVCKHQKVCGRRVNIFTAMDADAFCAMEMLSNKLKVFYHVSAKCIPVRDYSHVMESIQGATTQPPWPAVVCFNLGACADLRVLFASLKVPPPPHIFVVDFHLPAMVLGAGPADSSECGYTLVYAEEDLMTNKPTLGWGAATPASCVLALALEHENSTDPRDVLIASVGAAAQLLSFRLPQSSYEQWLSLLSQQLRHIMKRKQKRSRLGQCLSTRHREAFVPLLRFRPLSEVLGASSLVLFAMAEGRFSKTFDEMLTDMRLKLGLTAVGG
eukprot:GHVU01204590.1.p1 GENE.GHVU01204590.1~~GHVU01204590.1.p1  ORF type:complete len:301 (+),score=58.46 GHVU01204590.1:197-1099(+)